jgi:hypothetical protein
MNMRTEKEKQRAALIKLREISTVDPGLLLFKSRLSFCFNPGLTTFVQIQV